MIFRIRSKSNDCLSKSKKIKFNKNTHQKQTQSKKKNHYLCLSNQSNSQFLWGNILQNQMDIKSTIVAFQTTTNVKIDAKQKLRWRQTFLLKKQIINFISRQQLDPLLDKLNELKEKSITQNSLACLMIEFCNLREKIIGLKFKYTKQLIIYIKKKVLPFIDKSDKDHFNFLTARILYILALHIIKLEGVLLITKKQSSLVQPFTKKESTLAYLEQILLGKIYSHFFLQPFNSIELFIASKSVKILQFKIISKLNPILLFLKINQEAFKNSKSLSRFKRSQINWCLSALIQIFIRIMRKEGFFPLKIHKKNSTKFIKRALNKLLVWPLHQTKIEVINKNLDCFQSQNQKFLIKNSKKCRTNHKITRQIRLLKKHLHKSLMKIQFYKSETDCLSLNSFCLKDRNCQLVFFQVRIDEDKNFSIKITLKTNVNYEGIFKMQKMKFQDLSDQYLFAKKIWKIIKHKFNTDKTEFMPSLFSFETPPVEYMPPNIRIYCYIPILVAIHDMVIHYLRKTRVTKKLIGSIYPFPSSNLEQQQKSLKQNKQKSMEQKIFAKRLGFISFDKKLKKCISQHNNLVSLVCKDSKQLIVQINFDTQKYKLFDRQKTFSISNKENIQIMCKNIIQSHKQHRLESTRSRRIKILPKEKRQILDFIQKQEKKDQMVVWMQKIDKMLNEKTIKYQFERKFQIVYSDNYLDSIQNNIKTIKIKNRKYFKRKLTETAILKSQNKFQILKKVKHKNFSLFENQKHKTIMLNLNNQKSKLLYTKFRLYKQYFQQFSDFQFAKHYPKQTNLSQFEEKKICLYTSTTKISLNHIKTKIIKIRKKNKYGYVNIFETPDQMFILQIYIYPTGQKIYTLQPPQAILSKRTGQFEIDINEGRDSNSWKLNQTYDIKKIHSNAYTSELCDAQRFYQIINLN